MTAHDHLFRSTFSDPKRAIELLHYILPADVLAVVDFSTLKAVPGSLISKHLREHLADLLFSVQIHGREAAVYTLFEHKSSEDRGVGLQLLGYMADIWQIYESSHPGTPELPVIYPIVVHHGRPPWRSDTSFRARFPTLDQLPEGFQASIPEFHFTLFDLATLGETVLADFAVSALTRLSLLILQYAQSAPDLRELLLSYWDLLTEVEQAPNGGDALLRIFSYLTSIRGAPDIKVLRTITAKLSRGDNMQTIAEMWEHEGEIRGRLKGREEGLVLGRKEGLRTGRKEGRQEGRKEGRQDALREVLLRGLHRRFAELPTTLDQRIQTADTETLLRWTENLVVASSLDDVFADEPQP